VFLSGGAIRKYGSDAFDGQILSYAQTQEELDNLERLWVVLLKAKDRKFGYNVSNGGLGRGKWSEESRKKMSLSKKGNTYCLGRVLSLETREKISSAASKRTGNKNSFYGRKHSEETKDKIRKSRLGLEKVTV
jgi:group I intron endonuclease